MSRQRAIELLKKDLDSAPNTASVNGLIDDLLRAIRKLPPRPSTRLPFEGLFAESKELTASQFDAIAREFQLSTPILRAVVEVECNGKGFLPSGRPTILFEAPWFDEFTKGQFRASHPDLSTASSWAPHLYKGGEREWERYQRAANLSRVAARRSISMGLGQIMGLNHKAAGFNTVDEFFDAMHRSEAEQLRAMLRFITSKNLMAPLRAKNWRAFAKGYNGPLFFENKYDEKLERAFQKFNSLLQQ